VKLFTKNIGVKNLRRMKREELGLLGMTIAYNTNK